MWVYFEKKEEKKNIEMV